MDIQKMLAEMRVKLLEKPLTRMGRAADMIWIVFGEDIPGKDFRGEARTFSEYSLHIQCPFHLVHKRNLVVGSHDVYLPGEGVDADVFDWTTSERNSFYDEQALNLNTEVFPQTVKAIDMDEVGTLQIDVGIETYLRVFPNGGAVEEYWRFFAHKGPHWVMWE